MNLKGVKIPLTELECVTNTQVKVGGPIWYLNIKKGTAPEYIVFPLDYYHILPSGQLELIGYYELEEATKFADKELTKYTSSWLKTAWDEIDWSRIKELQVRDILDQRQAQAEIAQSGHCLQCPDFLKHVSQSHRYVLSYLVLIIFASLVRNAKRRMASQGEHLTAEATDVGSKSSTTSGL